MIRMVMVRMFKIIIMMISIFKMIAVNFVLQKFCLCKKNYKYEVCTSQSFSPQEYRGFIQIGHLTLINACHSLDSVQSDQIHLSTKASQHMHDCTFPIYQLRLLKGSLALVVLYSYDHKDVLCFTDPSDQKGCQRRLLANVGPRQGKRGGKRDRCQNKHKYVVIS